MGVLIHLSVTCEMPDPLEWLADAVDANEGICLDASEAHTLFDDVQDLLLCIAAQKHLIEMYERERDQIPITLN